MDIKFNRVEFYNQSLDNKIITRSGLLYIPRTGERLALGCDIFEVQFVSYNLDYMETDYEVWRVNVILEPCKK